MGAAAESAPSARRNRCATFVSRDTGTHTHKRRILLSARGAFCATRAGRASPRALALGEQRTEGEGSEHEVERSEHEVERLGMEQ